MLDLLGIETAKQKLKIKVINQEWGTKPVAAHDAVIISNVPALVRERKGFIEEVSSVAKKYDLYN